MVVCIIEEGVAGTIAHPLSKQCLRSDASLLGLAKLETTSRLWLFVKPPHRRCCHDDLSLHHSTAPTSQPWFDFIFTFIFTFTFHDSPTISLGISTWNKSRTPLCIVAHPLTSVSYAMSHITLPGIGPKTFPRIATGFDRTRRKCFLSGIVAQCIASSLCQRQ
jgi:hypothetical protein